MATQGLIEKMTKEFLILYHPWVARFYLLPNNHKPGNPGRLIVSSSGATMENISHFVDYFLQPGMFQLPSDIWDTMDYINKLWMLPILPPGSLVVILDISSLYTNIPQDKGLRACKEYLNLWESQAPPMADLFHLIQLILSVNSFVCNNTYTYVIHGTAMGTHMAPSYANLFLGKLEHEFLATQNKIPQTSLPYGPMANQLYVPL